MTERDDGCQFCGKRLARSWRTTKLIYETVVADGIPYAVHKACLKAMRRSPSGKHVCDQLLERMEARR